GFLVRKSECAAVLGAQPNATGDQHSDQCERAAARPDRLRDFPQARRQGRERRNDPVCLRPDVRWRFPPPERTDGDIAANCHDRVSAPVVPVRARDRCNLGAQWGLPTPAARPGRLRRALSAACGPDAGGTANAAVELAIYSSPAWLTAARRIDSICDIGSVAV